MQPAFHWEQDFDLLLSLLLTMHLLSMVIYRCKVFTSYYNHMKYI